MAGGQTKDGQGFAGVAALLVTTGMYFSTAGTCFLLKDNESFGKETGKLSASEQPVPITVDRRSSVRDLEMKWESFCWTTTIWSVTAR